MKIEIIEGISMSTSTTVWDRSRESDFKRIVSDIDDVIMVDAPVNDFPSVVLNIRATIIEREIFASMKDHVMWARTSRIDDVGEFTYPQMFRDSHSFCESMRGKMKSSDQNQDHHRKYLPMIADTSFSVRISIRSLSKVADYFHYLAGNCDSHIANLFYASSDRLNNLIDGLSASTPSYKPIKILNENFYKFPMEDGIVGDTLTISMKTSLSFRAQLIRSRCLNVTDDLFNRIGTIDTTSIGGLINLRVSGDYESWKSIIEKRSCWLVHHGMWSPLIRSVMSAYDMEQEVLPCGGKGTECTFRKDAMGRLEGVDPNPPCPVFVNVSDPHIHAVGSQFTDIMRTQAARDDRSEFWQEQINQIEDRS